MIITGIESVTKKKYKVELDGQLAFVLYKSELTCYHIEKDSELNEDDYDKILSEVLTPRAKQYVMHLLTNVDKTEHEIVRKLKEHGYPQQVISEAVNYVKSYGYVNDERYTRNYIEVHSQRMGHKQIKWKLLEKGIKKELIEPAWEGCEKPVEADLLRQMIRKKIGSKTNLDDKEIKKTAAYLYRKGFQGNLVWETLREFAAERSPGSEFE